MSALIQITFYEAISRPTDFGASTGNCHVLMCYATNIEAGQCGINATAVNEPT
jgi:hypothetical protein